MKATVKYCLAYAGYFHLTVLTHIPRLIPFSLFLSGKWKRRSYKAVGQTVHFVIEKIQQWNISGGTKEIYWLGQTKEKTTTERTQAAKEMRSVPCVTRGLDKTPLGAASETRCEIWGIPGSPSFPGVHPWTGGQGAQRRESPKCPSAWTMSSRAPSSAAPPSVEPSLTLNFTAPPKVIHSDFNYSRERASAQERQLLGPPPQRCPATGDPCRAGSGRLRPATT